MLEENDLPSNEVQCNTMFVSSKREKDLNFWGHLSSSLLTCDLSEYDQPMLPCSTIVQAECSMDTKVGEDELEIIYSNIKTENHPLSGQSRYKFNLYEETKFPLLRNKIKFENVYDYSNIKNDKLMTSSVFTDENHNIKHYINGILADIRSLRCICNIKGNGSQTYMDKHSIVLNKYLNIKKSLIKFENVDDSKRVTKRPKVESHEISKDLPKVMLHRVEASVSFLSYFQLRPTWKNNMILKSPEKAKRLGKFCRSRANTRPT